MILIYSIKKINTHFVLNKNNIVCFLGVTYQNCVKARNVFSHLVNLADTREKMLSLYRQDIINLDANIPFLDSLWLASDLAENNICLDNFSLYILNSLSLIKEVLTVDANADTDVLLICDNDEQVFIYSHILLNNGFVVQSKTNFLVLLRNVCGLFCGKISNFFKSILKILILKFLRVYHKIPIDLPLLKQAKILCVNWISPHSFNLESLLLRDKYFGDCLSHINKSDVALAVIGKPLDFSYSFYEIVQNSLSKNKNALFLEDFLKFKNVLFSFVKSFFFFKYMNYSFEIGGVNFTSLWKWFVFKDVIKGRIPLALEAYYAATEILKKTSAHATLLYPYENQPWEKLLCLAFSSRLPQNKIFAYQHFPIAKNYLTCYPSQAYLSQNREYKILLGDVFFGKWLEESGNHDHVLIGNFRFQTARNTVKKGNDVLPMDVKNLLLSCSIQLNDSLELIKKVINLIELTDNKIQEKIKLIINFHPLMQINQKELIYEILINSNINYSFTDLNADEILDDCYLVFYNSNSICFNAALRGIPSIFVKSDLQINLDRIPSVSFQITLDNDGLCLLNRLLSDESYYDEACEKFRVFFEKYYEPPRYRLIEKILTE